MHSLTQSKVSDQTVQATIAYCTYVYETYGRFPANFGTLDAFAWPVTAEQADRWRPMIAELSAPDDPHGWMLIGRVGSGEPPPVLRALLEELHALDEHGKLTPTGRALAALPLDPRMARMVVEANERGVLDEVLVIAAGLTIQDPRERPTDHQQAADQLHARFAHEHSDFLALLNLWRYLGEQQEVLSGNQFRRTVKREFLHYLRIREWQDLHGQLRGTARRLGMTLAEPAAEPEKIKQQIVDRRIEELLNPALDWDTSANGKRSLAAPLTRGDRRVISPVRDAHLAPVTPDVNGDVLVVPVAAQDPQHAIGNPPTDLSLRPNSPGYRLILNNVLFPAAKKKPLKT